MDTHTEGQVLVLWEAGAGRPRTTRAVLLAALDEAAATVAGAPVGSRDARLLALRRRCFGSALESLVDCPECAAELEIDLTVDDLTVPENPPGCSAVQVDGRHIEFRAVTSLDLLAVSGHSDARRALIERCVLVDDSPPQPQALTEAMLDAVSEGLAKLDPQAAVCVQIDCAVCAHSWSAPFDIGEYLWAELHASALRTMHDVHELATAYGWSESEVLAVSPNRRRQYLELATT